MAEFAGFGRLLGSSVPCQTPSPLRVAPRAPTSFLTTRSARPPQRALSDDWETALSYGVGIGHPGLCRWVAERHGGVDPKQVMVTNGSLEAGALLFAHLVKPGTGSRWSSRPTTARCSC